MKDYIRKNGILLGILFFVSIVLLLFSRAKAGFFIDEIHTYGLSNSHNAPYISDAVGGNLKDTVISREKLIEYATVDSSEILDFKSVYDNQVKDVHPPLYYFLFHFASIFAGENFSKWTGIILNYVIFIACLVMLYKLAMEIFSDNKSASYCAVILYGISTMGISTAVYLRMYMLLSLFTVLLAYYAVKIIRTDELRYYIISAGTITLGLLTQYYFVFYAFFLCAVICIYFISKKRYSSFLKFALLAVAGVALMLLVFPASIKHIFVGNGKVVGGVSVIEAIKDTSKYSERINKYMHLVTYGLKSAIICACLAIIVYRKIEFKHEILIVVLPAILAWAAVTIVSPIYEERYIYNLAPIFVILACFFIKDDLKAVPVAAVVCIICLFISKPNNLFPKYLEFDETLKPYTNSSCVYLQDDRFEGLTYDFEQLLMFDEIYATDSTDKASKYIDGKGTKYAVVFIDEDEYWSSGFDPDELLPEIIDNSTYDNYSQLYTNGFSGAYLLSKGAA